MVPARDATAAPCAFGALDAGADGGWAGRPDRFGPLAPQARPAGALRRLPARGRRRRVRVLRGDNVAG